MCCRAACTECVLGMLPLSLWLDSLCLSSSGVVHVCRCNTLPASFVRPHKRQIQLSFTSPMQSHVYRLCLHPLLWRLLYDSPSRVFLLGCTAGCAAVPAWLLPFCFGVSASAWHVVFRARVRVRVLYGSLPLRTHCLMQSWCLWACRHMLPRQVCR